ncbi:MAG: type II toxin-antitoxin system VapC family toxin [Acidimicrobiales bacterium]
MAAAAERGPLVINPMIYAEVSVRFATIEELDDALPHDDFLRVPLPWDATFLAGKAYLNYRKNGGARTSPLPDLFTGAHAAVAGLSLLTRDRGRYAPYFPTVHLDTP